MGKIMNEAAPLPAPRNREAMPLSTKPRVESRCLFRGNNEIIIVHQSEEYSLRITRNGKLILTK